MRHERASLPPLLSLLLLLLPASGHLGAQEDPVGLERLFAHGYIMQDLNGDGIIDALRARILLPGGAGSPELAAAADIGARLGWETTAMDPGLAMPAGSGRRLEIPVILIQPDEEALRRSGLSPGTLAQGLAPGQGRVRHIPPGERYRAGGAAVTGRDATGLLAAAGWLSSRFPSLWDPSGDSLHTVTDRLGTWFEEARAPLTGLSVRSAVVDAERSGLLGLEVQGTVSDEAFLTRIGRLVRGEAAGDSLLERALQERGSLLPSGLHTITLHLEGPGGGARTFVMEPEERRPWRRPEVPSARPASGFSLSDFYRVGGIYADTDRDLLGDRTGAWLALTGGGGPAIVDLAARIGLEATGIRLPLVHPVGSSDPVPERGLPILWGTEPGPADRLLREGRVLLADGGAGTGYMEYVAGAFGAEDAVVMSGDEEGLEAITSWAARRMPALWEPGPGTFELGEVEDEVRRFFQARGGAGQAALALSKLGDWLDRLEGRPMERLHAELAAEETPEGLVGVIRDLLGERFPGTEATVDLYPTGFGGDRLIFEQDVEIPWEVEKVRRRLRETFFPRVGPSNGGSVRIRVSEPAAVRESMVEEVREGIRERGGDPARFEVEVLSAYKQGYSWLTERVLPGLRRLPLERIEISYHTLKDSDEVRWQTIAASTRWLQELYPADEVLARELGIPDSVITYRPTLTRNPIYTLTAYDEQDTVLLESSFTPRYVVRPFFDLFPEYEMVRVTTGWARAEVDGEAVLDERVVTDPERFWEVLQTDTYRRIVEYVMDIQEGAPSPSNAPFFDRFEVDLTLSEPDRRIGVDEEVISSAEALHEDIYFETLTLFDLIGARYQVGGLDYPGRVLPWIHVAEEGGPGRARITFTGKERAEPVLRLTHMSAGAEPERWSYRLSPLRLEPPVLRGASVRAGDQGVRTLLFEVAAADSLDRWEAYRLRGSEEAIDRTFLSTERLSDMLGRLRSFHDAGIFQDDLSYDRVGSLLFRFTLEDSLAYTRTAGLPRSGAPRTTRLPALDPGPWTWEGDRIVQWEEPIGLEENRTILTRLSAFDGVRAYHAGRSFLGHDIFAAEFTVPHEASMVSRPKLIATKPVLFLSGRQHANEVSSTSHLLRLGELLATDPAYAELLRRVNVVIHPITNPDGVEVAMAMQEENPDFMLHAGYLGALGVDATSGSSSPDPIYPESKVRPLLEEMWLPDVYLNLHGYPSHEWVQYFAGYSAWVRSRRGGQRSWWAPRGWFIPGFTWVDDPDHPEIETAQFALLDSIAAAVTGEPEVEAMNRRLYDRYRKYGRQDTEGFREYFHKGMLVYLSLTGREVRGSGPGGPTIQWFSATTEAPDETARGAWLELVCTAGLAHTSAVLRYLSDGPSRTGREAEESGGAVERRVFRKRPVLPPKR